MIRVAVVISDAGALAVRSLRRPHRNASLRRAWRQGFFLVGHFLEMRASIRSAMERRIGAQRWTIIDDDPIIYALSDDSDVHASDQASVVVQKINVRAAETLRDKDRAFVRAYDQIDDVWIGYGDLSERALAVDGRREALREHHCLFRRSLDRERRSLIREARRRREQKTRKKGGKVERARDCAFRPLLNHCHRPAGSRHAPRTHCDTIMAREPTVALDPGDCSLIELPSSGETDGSAGPVNSSPARPDKDRAPSPLRCGCRGPASGSKRSCA